MHGRIVDTQGEPLALANVLLFTLADSAFVKGAVAGEDGTFRFVDRAPGNYRCQASVVGYPSCWSAPFQLQDQAGEMSLDEIVLSGSTDLAEVQVY